MNNTQLTFHRQRKDKRDIAITYYRLFSAYFDLKVTPNEILVLAHLSLHNGLATGGARKKFIEKYPSATKASLDNTISRLKKKGFIEERNEQSRSKVAAIKSRLILNTANDNYKFEFTCGLRQELIPETTNSVEEQ